MKERPGSFVSIAALLALVPFLLSGCGGGSDVPEPSAPTVAAQVEVSDHDDADKPKIQRAPDGALIVVYGDAPDAARRVYDVKAAKERPARDIYAKSCKPDAVRTCDRARDWSAAVNLSRSSARSSMRADWRGDGVARDYAGDIDKPNIKASGPVLVVTWVGKYCPDGDLVTAGVQPPVQRATEYLERGGRVIPFSCVWVARSVDAGQTWAPAVQLSTGERDAIQDANAGNYSPDTKQGRVAITWQEDPQGLLLGEAEGPGDGAAGSNTSGGSDIWYVSATVNLSNNPATVEDDFVLAQPVRLTDNRSGFLAIVEGQRVIDAAGAAVPANQIEAGTVGASRANVGLDGGTAIVAYEEKKGAGEAEGKYVRYVTFPLGDPPAGAGRAGCIISDPAKNARRVRFLTQSATDAGTAGLQLAIFWREGVGGQGATADIVLRRGKGGIGAANLVPAVDARCATSDPAVAAALRNARAENMSSRASVATVADDGLRDDTQANAAENAIAHRGVLRGPDLWIGYTYTKSLARMATQETNYNFFIRKFDAATRRWELPRNVTRITDRRINVREPRILGTPKSSPAACPTGAPDDPSTTDPAQCQDTDVLYLAWGTQENVVAGGDLGLFIAASTDGGANFSAPVRLSAAAGALFDDDESAYETQLVARPDGLRFWSVFSERVLASGRTAVIYRSGRLEKN
ncbi:MAG: hypothetical protein K0S48_2241 [Ramlibacter sp.]|nr:hypothetical protein [Ramlibacter sp.]